MNNKLEKMKEKVQFCLHVAKNHLLNSGRVAPVALFSKEGLDDFPMLLSMGDEREKERTQLEVQTFIRQNRPDFAVVVSEAWMKSVKAEDSSKYKRGDVEKSRDKVEIIIVVGGNPDMTYGIIQPFHREKKKIVFDQPIENTGGFETAFFGNAWEELAVKEKPTFH